MLYLRDSEIHHDHPRVRDHMVLCVAFAFQRCLFVGFKTSCFLYYGIEVLKLRSLYCG